MIKGFGKFSLNEEVYNSECPMPKCKELLEDVGNMGLYLAKCKGKGRVVNEKVIKEMVFEQRDKKEFLTFEDRK